MMEQMGQMYDFSFFNPSGHYNLNLGKPFQRELAQLLVVMNKENFDAIVAGTRADRSKDGNKSCFRNEIYNTVKFLWDPLWTLPKDGRLEFDFNFFNNRPLSNKDETKDFHKVIDWFK